MTAGATSNGLGAALLRIVAGHVCLHAAMTGARLAAPLLALGQGYSNAAAGVLVALFALTQIFLAIPAGRYADRHGLKRPLALSVAAIVTGVGLAAIWPVYPVLCVTALMTGGAIGSATIALQRHAGRLAQTSIEVKQVFSWLAIAPALSNFLGPVAAGFVIDHAGFRAAFALLASLPLVAWAVIRTVREVPNDAPASGARRAAWDLLDVPHMRRLLVMNWFMSASWDLHSFMVPVLGHERGLNASTIGSILGSFAIAAAAVRVVMPAVASRLREWAMVTGAIALSGTAFFVYPFSRSPLEMAACSAVIGLAQGVVQPMIMSMLHQITPPHRHGEALAVRLVLLNVSSVSMPLVFGATSAVIGAAGLFWGMGTVIGAGSLLGFGLPRGEADPGGR